MKILKLFIAFLIFCSMKSFADEGIIMLTSAEYPPYYGETLLNRGPVTEIIIEAYKKVGYDVIVDFYPWVRAEKLAEYGKYDGMFPPWLTEKRKGYFAFSDPLFPNEIGFLARKELNITYITYDDLQEYTIGIGRGYANPEGFDTTILKVDEATTDLQNIQKLISVLF